jgi:hypothetical protein
MPKVIATLFGAADGWRGRTYPLAQTSARPLGEVSKKGFDLIPRFKVRCAGSWIMCGKARER